MIIYKYINTNRFGAYAKNYTESICNFKLKQQSKGIGFHEKIKKCQEKYSSNFPLKEVERIFYLTNQITRCIDYDEEGTLRYLKASEQTEILKLLCKVTIWVKTTC